MDFISKDIKKHLAFKSLELIVLFIFIVKFGHLAYTISFTDVKVHFIIDWIIFSLFYLILWRFLYSVFITIIEISTFKFLLNSSVDIVQKKENKKENIKNEETNV